MRGGVLAATMAVLALAGASAPAAAFAGDGTFPDSLASTLPIGTGTHPISVAIGDFNNDGDQDLAVADYGAPAGVSIYLGGAGATFSGPTFFPAAAGIEWSIAVGDFNADGKEDLAVANASTGNVEVLIGDGVGGFGVLGPVGITPAASPRSVVVSDFNADGNEDIAAADYAADKVKVSLGVGNGTFLAPVATTVAAKPTAVAVGDFDTDGYPDLVVSSGDESNIQVLRNSAHDGTFTPSFTDKVGTAHDPYALAVGDFNRDGRLDIAVDCSGSNALTVILGTQFGLGAPNSYSGLGNFPQSVAVGDFNSDGNEDLASAAQGMAVDLGLGPGSFTPPTTYTAATNARGVALGDFDSDGNEDAVVVGDESITVRLGAGTSPLAGNLLVNGGFESAGAAASRTADDPAAPTPGWSTAGGMTHARYGISPNKDYLDHIQAPRWSGGESYLWGGKGAPGHNSSATQTVDVSASAGSIDAGLATTRLSADLGGNGVYDDRMKATATFLDAGSAAIGSFDIGPVNPADRSRLTVLLPRSGSAAVPSGTRQIQVVLTADNNSDAYSSGYADNVQLTLDAPVPPESTPPPDTTPPDTTAPDTTKGKGPKKRTTRHMARFTFSSEPDATFNCKLDKKDFAPCTSPRRLKHLKLGKHVFQVEAVDAAGNTDPSPARWRWRVVPKPH